ncbi:hypothetical protein PINS_up001182 [Pythium insidiosum]|nr:hypothetical protein PINS_up001182 [Pythium insidiosum]
MSTSRPRSIPAKFRAGELPVHLSKERQDDGSELLEDDDLADLTFDDEDDADVDVDEVAQSVEGEHGSQALTAKK